MNLSEVYGIPIDMSINKSELRVNNSFCDQLSMVAKVMGTRLTPFRFGMVMGADASKDSGVLHLEGAQGLAGVYNTIFSEIVVYRMQQLEERGMKFECDPNTVTPLSLSLFYDYLLSVSICYIEIPKTITKNGVKSDTYDKFLATKNVALISEWTGLPMGDIVKKYGERLTTRLADLFDSNLRIGKLQFTKGNRKVSLPRGAINIDGMTCMPLFVVNNFTKGFADYLRKGMLKFTFGRDNGVQRTVVSTLSTEVLMHYYKDSEYIQMCLRNTSFLDITLGEMESTSTMLRGYIKIPEVGCSRYDTSGTRAVNMLRLSKIEVVTEADPTFIDVDLESIQDNFRTCLEDFIRTNDPAFALSQMKEMCKDLFNEDLPSDITTPVRGMTYLLRRAQDMSLVFSTVFKRELHLFILNRPHLFPLYTGAPTKYSAESMGNFL